MRVKFTQGYIQGLPILVYHSLYVNVQVIKLLLRDRFDCDSFRVQVGDLKSSLLDIIDGNVIKVQFIGVCAEGDVLQIDQVLLIVPAAQKRIVKEGYLQRDQCIIDM